MKERVGVGKGLSDGWFPARPLQIVTSRSRVRRPENVFGPVDRVSDPQGDRQGRAGHGRMSRDKFEFLVRAFHFRELVSVVEHDKTKTR